MKSLSQFANDLRRLPRVVAQRVAAEAAPEISRLSKETFDASEDPYGVAWDPAKDGGQITLRKTGALARFVYYVAIGTRLRVVLGVPYAKYQIGKRAVFPRAGAGLPESYVQTLQRIAVKVIKQELHAP